MAPNFSNTSEAVDSFSAPQEGNVFSFETGQILPENDLRVYFRKLFVPQHMLWPIVSFGIWGSIFGCIFAIYTLYEPPTVTIVEEHDPIVESQLTSINKKLSSVDAHLSAVDAHVHSCQSGAPLKHKIHHRRRISQPQNEYQERQLELQQSELQHGVYELNIIRSLNKEEDRPQQDDGDN